MSLGDAAEAIHKAAADKAAANAAFRATVTAVSTPLVSIRREAETTGSTATYAVATPFVLAIGDVVLCLPLGDQPVILGIIQRTAPVDAELAAPAIDDFTNAPHTHANAAGGGVLTGYQKKDTGYFAAPGPGVMDATTVTALASGQSFARYLGMVPADVTSVEVNVRVTTAAATITWAEVGLASANSATGGSLTLLGTVTNVAATFNSTGNKTVTFAITVPAGTFLYLIGGSSATTPFQLRGTLPDELGVGVVRLATARPSTMASPTAFGSSTNSTGAVHCIARWS